MVSPILERKPSGHVTVIESQPQGDVEAGSRHFEGIRYRLWIIGENC